MTKIAIVAAAALALAGCNTVAGVGKDMSAVGGVVTKTANSAAKAKPSRTASCVQDSRVPPRSCPPVKTIKAKSSIKQVAKPAPKQASATATKQAAEAPTATPVKTSAKPAKAKSGWWQ